jgi:hypothetical protein
MLNTILQMLTHVTKRALPRLAGGHAKCRRALHPDVRLAPSDQRMVLLAVQSGRVFVCNQVGKRICEALVANREPEQIIESLARNYGITFEQAREDITLFMDSLEAHGLLVNQAMPDQTFAVVGRERTAQPLAPTSVS